MSSVVSSAPLSLIWRGVWDSDGVNSSGYQRYDCVSHSVTSPTARTDVYFAVTEIAAGGAEPNPTSGQTTWKLLLHGGTVGGSTNVTDGSIVFRNADGDNQVLNAVSDTVVEVINGVPQFVNRPVGAGGSFFIGYTHPNTPPHTSVPTSNTFFLSGGRVFGLGTMQEGYMSNHSSNLGSTQVLSSTAETMYPASFLPKEDPQLSIGKIFHGYRVVFAIGQDDKSKVYGLGLKAGRFGDGEDIATNPTTLVEDSFQKIDYFDDNSINIEHIVTPFIGGANSLNDVTVAADANLRNQSALAYFIEEVVDVGGSDTGGRVFVSAGAITDSTLAPGLNLDGTVQEISGFTEPIIGGSMFHEAAFFWSKRKVFGIGRVTLTAGGAQVASGAVDSVSDLSGNIFTSDIVSFFNTDDISAVLTLADGRAYYYNYKSPRGTRTSPLFEQIPVISGKLFSKVTCFSNGQTIAALMNDGTVYVEGVVRQENVNHTITGLQQINLPLSLVAQNIVHDRLQALHIITTDGNVLTQREVQYTGIFLSSQYLHNALVGSSTTVACSLYTDPGWAGRANDIVYHDGVDVAMISISTEDGYIYNSNTVGGTVSQSQGSVGELVSESGRNVGVNHQFQVYYSNTTGASVTASSFSNSNAHSGTGLLNASGTWSIQINGSMVQRPTLRSYQVI